MRSHMVILLVFKMDMAAAGPVSPFLPSRDLRTCGKCSPLKECVIRWVFRINIASSMAGTSYSTKQSNKVTIAFSVSLCIH